MSGRNRGHPNQLKGPPIHEPPFGRPMPSMPHPALLEEMREAQFGRGGGHGHQMLPPHPAYIEERLAAQHQDIQGLLGDNQRLAATHVALKQELEAAQHELQRMGHIAGSLHAEKDVQLRDVYERSMKMESELHAVESMKAELANTRIDVQKLAAARQELAAQVQALTQDLTRANADLQQVPALKADIETMKQEVERARAAVEYERKGQAERYEQGQAMEKNMILIAREVEKLRAEVANGDMRLRAANTPPAAAAAAAGGGYGGNYNNNSNPEVAGGGGYGGGGANPYSVPAGGYGMNPVQGSAESGQYGPGAWGGYDMHHHQQQQRPAAGGHR